MNIAASPPPGRRPGAFLRSRWLALLPVLLSVLIYWQTTGFQFVTYDDYELVAQNGDYLSHLSNVAASFKTHAFTTHRAQSVYYRPLLLVSFIADYQVWGLDPEGYHLTNLLLHVLTVLGVFLLATRLLGEGVAAVAASGIVAVHPVQTEAVAWVAGRNDLLLGLFVVLMMNAYVRYRERPPHSPSTTGGREGSFWTVLLAFAGALFTKESGAFAILLLPLYDVCYGHIRLKQLPPDRRTLANYSLAGMLLVLYLGVRLMIFGEVIGAEKLYGGGSTLLGRIGQAPALAAAHLAFLLAPFRLSVAHPMDELLWARAPWSWLALLVPVLLVPLFIWSWRRGERAICFGLGWLGVGFLPLMNIFPVSVPVLEHRLYVPVIGFALALSRAGYLLLAAPAGAAAAGFAGKSPGKNRREEAGERPPLLPQRRGERIFAQIAGVLILALTAASFLRVPVWRSSETLWKDAIGKAPGYSRAYFNLAGYYFEQRQYGQTTGLLEKYLALVPEDAGARSKLRQSYYLAGQYREAARVCREMIARSPANVNRYAEAAELYMQLSEGDSAAAIYKEGIARNPGSYELCDLLGRVYVRLDRPGEAESFYRRAIGLNPGFAQARFDLGLLYAAGGRGRDAREAIEGGLRYGDPGKEVAQLLYHLYAEAGDTARATEIRRRYGF